ncbi:MAG: hypothetical protein GY722_25245 [bacterium]|nr:hypothetical protein [bacterium]
MTTRQRDTYRRLLQTARTFHEVAFGLTVGIAVLLLLEPYSAAAGLAARWMLLPIGGLLLGIAVLDSRSCRPVFYRLAAARSRRSPRSYRGFLRQAYGQIWRPGNAEHTGRPEPWLSSREERRPRRGWLGPPRRQRRGRK